MDRGLISRLSITRIEFKMSKFGSGYRRKSGNCNKPFRRCQDQFSDEPYLPRTHAGGKRAGFHSGNQNHTGESASTSDKDYRPKGALLSDVAPSMSNPLGKGFDRERVKHPPQLRGKEIGLWYASRNKDKMKDKKKERKEDKVVEVLISPSLQNYIEEVLYKAGTTICCEQEPSQIEDEEKEGPVTFEDKINNVRIVPCEQNPELDKMLYNDFQKKKNSSHYLEMVAVRENLPVFAMKDEIVDLIEQNQVVVISGGTGCGKTTQIAQFVLDHYILNNKGSLCNIVCTQPRRISAITIAERVAAERDEPLGNSIGYQIRLENVSSKQTSGCINFMTTGILLATLESEPVLNKITHLFLDEIHERNIDSDLLLALLKYILPKRPEMKVILMSATVNEDSFCAYFSNAPKIVVPSFTYPVEEIFLEDILQKTGFTFEPCRKPNKDPVFHDYILPYVRDMQEKRQYPSSVLNQLRNPNSEVLNISLLTAIVHYICTTEEIGAILVFLPGISDITAMQRTICSSPWYSPDRHIIATVHSILPSSEQKKAFDVPPKGVWKIVLGTTIVETGITINDIRYVVDSGKAKFSGYDMEGNIATLAPKWITLANAKQRRGRAGRTKPGKCYKAYSKIRQELFEKYPTPEIQSTSLEDVIIKAKLLQLGHVAPFLSKLMDPPDSKMVDLSLRMLQNLSILDSEERLTPLGYHVSKLPVHPRMGKMILMGALFSCIDPVVGIAACMSFKDPFVTPIGAEEEVDRIKEQLSDGEKSDHFIYSETLRLWEENEAHGLGDKFARDHFLSIHTLKRLREFKTYFVKILHSMNFLVSTNVKDPSNNVHSENRALVKAIVCSGLYPNVAIYKKALKKQEHLLKTVDQDRVLFHMKSYLSKIPWFESPFFVYHVILKSSSIFIHDASMITTMPLIFFGERLEIQNKNGQYYLLIDDNIKFKTTKQTGVMVKYLRNLLYEILKKAVTNPEAFKWHSEDSKTEILSAIVTLLSSEDMTPFAEKTDKGFQETKYVSRIHV